ncbi:hypothetical protein ACJ72_01791 [Emergomyces africanus]|uniref:Exosome complex component CSL4 C-terminal domain-containing protein n=1 Tax=Emergomyces africanus TaxID=1955775 RepID=A0A1B7P482_9EURO|nr:hypothetical protein ACJ72_01791 [Emergomyces africanus]
MAVSLPSIAVPGQRLGPITSFIPGPGTHIQDSFVCASIAGPVVLQQGEQLSTPKPKIQQQQAILKNQQQQQQQQRALVSVARSFAQRLDGYGTVTGNNTLQSQRSLNTTATTIPMAKRQKYKYNTLPAVDSIVLARVTRVQKRQATLSILVVLDDVRSSSSSSSSPYPTTTTIPDDLPPSLLSTTNADPLNADDLRFQALIRKEDVRAVEKDRVVMDEMFRVGDIVRAVVISLGDQSFYYCSTARNELGVVMGRSEEGNVLVPVSWREMVDRRTGRREARKVARPF